VYRYEDSNAVSYWPLDMFEIIRTYAQCRFYQWVFWNKYESASSPLRLITELPRDQLRKAMKAGAGEVVDRKVLIERFKGYRPASEIELYVFAIFIRGIWRCRVLR
jgi:hypothetical protein